MPRDTADLAEFGDYLDQTAARRLYLVPPAPCPFLDDGLTIPTHIDPPMSRLFPGFETFADPLEAARYDIRIASICRNGAEATVNEAIVEFWLATGRERAEWRAALRRRLPMLRNARVKYRQAFANRTQIGR